MYVTVLAQRKLTYTAAANQAGQQSVLLPATSTSSAQCMLEQYAAGQCSGHTVPGPADVDKTQLVWQQRLTSSDALQNAADLQPHANPLSQVLKIDLQLRLPQRHRLRSRDDSIADQRPIFSYFNCRLLTFVVYTAGILNYAHKIAVFNFFRLIVRYVDSSCQ